MINEQDVRNKVTVDNIKTQVNHVIRVQFCGSFRFNLLLEWSQSWHIENLFEKEVGCLPI